MFLFFIPQIVKSSVTYSITNIIIGNISDIATNIIVEKPLLAISCTQISYLSSIVVAVNETILDHKVLRLSWCEVNKNDINNSHIHNCTCNMWSKAVVPNLFGAMDSLTHKMAKICRPLPKMRVVQAL